MPTPFSPPALLANPHVQSALASLHPRCAMVRRASADMIRTSRSELLDCGEGVRLQGFRSLPAGDVEPRGLAILLHGWEGSAESTYLLSCARHLLVKGYEVFRLNFRDHGGTHSLNEELFHSCRLDEVVEAVAALALPGPGTERRSVFLVGFSLGGNFALRVALRAADRGIALRHVVAVSPPLDPTHVLENMERAPRVYERYFLLKWRRSLQRKQRAFPARYDFEGWMRNERLRDATRRLIESHSSYPTLEAYLDGYSIAGDRLRRLAVSSTLLTAADDPIVPVSDARALRASPELRLEIHERGGHCAFLDGLGATSWADRRIAAILDTAELGG